MDGKWLVEMGHPRKMHFDDVKDNMKTFGLSQEDA